MEICMGETHYDHLGGTRHYYWICEGGDCEESREIMYFESEGSLSEHLRTFINLQYSKVAMSTSTPLVHRI